MRRLGLIGGLLLLLCFARVFGQVSADSLFASAVAAYREGRYQETLIFLETLDKVYPGHLRQTACLLMRGKALYKLTEYRPALETFERLRRDYPASQYADDGLYGQAKAFYRMDEFTASAARVLDVLDANGDKRLVRKAALLSADIMDNRLTEDDLVRLGKMVTGDKAKAVVALKLGQRRLDARRFKEALSGLQDYLEDHPQTPYAPQIQAMIARAQDPNTGEFKLGVILPLSGTLADQGKEILGGIQFALDGFLRANPNAKIELVVEDSQSRIVQAVAAAQALCDDPAVTAIIGELESPVTAAIAAVAQEREIPLIVPVASAEDLTQIGSFVFQMNSSLKSQGGAMARYAIKALGLRKFAVLHPDDDYGRQIGQGFSRVVQNLGGRIIVDASYDPNEKNMEQAIKNQIRRIREAGIKQMIQDSLLVLLKSGNNPYPRRPGVIYEHRSLSALLDSTSFVDFVESSIDAVFFPVYREELQYVIPQFAFSNFRAQILGGSAWNDMDILLTNKLYVNNAIFMTDYIEENNPRLVRFQDQYRKIVRKSPGKMALFGYDTANLILKTAMSNSEREECRDALSQTAEFPGVRGPITFQEQRENPFVYMLQFRDDRIIRIQ